MKFIGFGCSFTFGSELVSPELSGYIDPRTNSEVWDMHHQNTKYREAHCWLGLLAKRFDCPWDNHAQPACSNFAIAHHVGDYIRNRWDRNEKIVVCVGWTERTRMSWLSDKWLHNGFVLPEDKWARSAKEWVTHSTDYSHDMYTDNAKLFVNSICTAHDIQILQFNSIGFHKPAGYQNYFIDGASMDSMLQQAQQEDPRLKLYASGQHPNEAGHEYFTIRLHEFAKQRIIL